MNSKLQGSPRNSTQVKSDSQAPTRENLWTHLSSFPCYSLRGSVPMHTRHETFDYERERGKK